MEELGIEHDRPVVYQDNKSSIQVAQNGLNHSKRLKHVNQHHLFVTSYINDGTLELKYIPTEEMLADIFTKPLQGECFRRMCGKLGLVKSNVNDAHKIKG